MKKYLIYPSNMDSDDSSRLDQVLALAFAPYSQEGYILLRTPEALLEEIHNLHHSHLLLAVHLGKSGLNSMLYQIICILREHENCLEGCVGGVIVDGCQELYTKETGREIVFTMNRAGCTLPGGSLVEATGSLKNYIIQADNGHLTLQQAYEASACSLLEQIHSFKFKPHQKPKLLCIHANNHFSSNTYAVWEKVKEQLSDFHIEEFNARNGTIQDCTGCPFQMCKHYSEIGSCFYGGSIVEEAYPAVEACDGIIFLAPNYNDAISANLSAFINRLTSLYRKVSFSDKYLFSIIVSGYSGGDIVANQLISGLNMNKKFILPGKFAFFNTANSPGSVFEDESIHEKITEYANLIRFYLKSLE